MKPTRNMKIVSFLFLVAIAATFAFAILGGMAESRFLAAQPTATAMPKAGAAAAQPSQAAAPPLLAHLLTPPPQWMTAYGNEPVERVCTVWTLQALRQTAIAQARVIDALTARVAALEAAGKAIDAVPTTIDNAKAEAKP